MDAADTLRDGLAEAVSAIQNEPDPAIRAQLAHTSTDLLQHALVAIARERRAALRALFDQGWTGPEVGTLLGLTRQRAHQIAQGG